MDNARESLSSRNLENRIIEDRISSFVVEKSVIVEPNEPLFRCIEICEKMSACMRGIVKSSWTF